MHNDAMDDMAVAGGAMGGLLDVRRLPFSLGTESILGTVTPRATLVRVLRW
jgi:hypothetical protein